MFDRVASFTDSKAGRGALFGVAVALLVAAQVLLYARFVLYDTDRLSDRAVVALDDPGLREKLATQIVNKIAGEEPGLEQYRELLQTTAAHVVASPEFEQALRVSLAQTQRATFDDSIDSVGLRVPGTVDLIRNELTISNPTVAELLPTQNTTAIVQRTDKVGGANAVAGLLNAFWKAAVVILLAALNLLLLWVLFAGDRFRAARWAGWALAVAGLAVVIGVEIVIFRLLLRIQGFGVHDVAHQAFGPILAPLRLVSKILIAAGAVVVAAVLGARQTTDLHHNVGASVTIWIKQAFGRDAPRWRRALCLLLCVLAAAFLILQPRGSLVAAAFVAGVLLAAQGLRELTLFAAGHPSRAAQRPGPALRVVVAGVAVLASAVIAVVTWPSEARPQWQINSASACNGSQLLCDKPLAEITLPATHNSMNAVGDGWVFPQQELDIEQQLSDGIRGFLVDVYPARAAGNAAFTEDSEFRNALTNALEQFSGHVGEDLVAKARVLRSRIARAEPGAKRELFMCHAFCELGAVSARDVLNTISSWLAHHDHDIVMIVIEDYVSAKEIVETFEQAGLADFAYDGEITKDHPTLNELIEQQKRLLVFSERLEKPLKWLKPAFKAMQDTPFDLGRQALLDDNCEANRGSVENPLLLLNHFVSRIPPELGDARIVNKAEHVREHVTRCLNNPDAGSRKPTIIAVDFYKRGDWRDIVDELNGVPHN